MKVLVTGGSGFVGRVVVHELLERQYSVRLLVRRPIQFPISDIPGKVETVAGNLLQVMDWSKLLEGIDAVIHLVGIISQIGDNTFQRVHVEATQNLVSAMQQHGVQRLVHMSALGTKSGAKSVYHQTKWQAEESVRSSSLIYTIFRPSIIYGPKDQFVNLFNRMSRFSPIIPIMGKGQSLLQPIHVNAVAKAFVEALKESRCQRATLDLCGYEKLTFCQIVDQIMQVTNRKRFKLHIPLSIANVLATSFEYLFPLLLRQAPPLNRDQLIMLQENNIGEAEPAHDLFGLPRMRFAEGIGQYL